MKTFRDLKVGDELLIINNKTKQSFYARITVNNPNYAGLYYVSSSVSINYTGLFDYIDCDEETVGVDYENGLTILIPARENSIKEGDEDPKYWEDLGENSRLWVIDKKKSCYEIKEDRPFLVFIADKWMVLLIHKNTVLIEIKSDSVVEDDNYVISISKRELCNDINKKLNNKINFNLAKIDEYKELVNSLKRNL